MTFDKLRPAPAPAPAPPEEDPEGRDVSSDGMSACLIRSIEISSQGGDVTEEGRESERLDEVRVVDAIAFVDDLTFDANFWFRFTYKGWYRL